MSLLTNSVTSPDEWDLDPRSIPDCELWFDAADTRTITGTSPVTAWANKGRFAISATNDVGTCVSGAGTINGRNFISIPKGTNLQFTCAFPVQDRSIFMVFRMQDQILTQFFSPINRGTASTSQFLVLLSRSSSTSYHYNIAIGNGLGTRINAQSGYASAPATFSQLANPVPNFFGAPAVYGIVHSSAATSLNCISVNGAEYRGGTVPTTLTTSLVASGYDTANLKYVINNSDTGIYNTGMDCCEILYYSRALGDSERKAIEGYLGWKWGIVKRDIAVTPLSVPNCVAWFDADVDYSDAASRATSFTFSSGDNIQAWIDKSGNGNTATAVSANRATLTPNAFGGNGRCCASFTQAVTVSLISGLILPPTQSFTLFAVASSATFGSRRSVCTVNSYPGTVGGYVSLQQNTSNPGVWTWSGGTGFEGFTTGVTLGALPRTDILSAVWSPGSCQYTANGLRQPISTATPTALTTNGQFVISGVNSGTTFGTSWAGQIYEIIVYTGVLSEDNRLLIERYLALKWNVSNYMGSMVRYHPARFWRTFNRYMNPLDPLNCVCWLDAADAATIVLSGTSVTQWTDKSGYAYHATPQLTGTSVAPTYANNGVVFAGTSVLNTPLPNSSLTQMTYFIVGDSPSGSQLFIAGKSPNNSTNRVWFISVTSGGLQRTEGYGGTIVNTGAAITPNNRFLYNGTLVSAGTSTMFLNGTLTNTKTGTLTYSGIGTTAIGGYIDDSNPNGAARMTGRLNEILIFNTALSLSQIQRIEGYLAWKWGLATLLPSTHPFFPTRLPPDSSVAHPTQTQNSSTFDVMLWLDASDPYGTGVLPPSGTPLAQWVDKSGNGKTAFQTTTSRRPTFTYDNGFPAVSFDAASSQRMEANGPLLSGASYNSYSIFVVYRMPTAAANNTIFFLPKTAPSATEANSIYTVFRTSNNTSTKEFFARYNTSTTKTQTSSPQTGESLNAITDNGLANTTVIMFFNGVDTGVGPTLVGGTGLTANDNSASRYVIGAQVFSSTFANFATAFVKEILVIRRQVGAPERQRIEGYLAWKWGFNTSLPTTHAYYESKP